MGLPLLSMKTPLVEVDLRKHSVKLAPSSPTAKANFTIPLGPTGSDIGATINLNASVNYKDNVWLSGDFRLQGIRSLQGKFYLHSSAHSVRLQ